MDCHFILFITIRYRQLILYLDDLLDELYGVCVFQNRFAKYLIGKCVVVYFDDILIYSNCIDDYILHVRSMLLLLRQECLYVSLEKCTFRTSEVVSLGYVVGSKGVKVYDEKSWPTPKIVGDVRSFNRFFIKYFSTLASPLNGVVKKDVALKERLTNAFILAFLNFRKTFELEYDASNVGVGVKLLQKGHPIAYF
ncbi:Retrovirus-related Pol polyprotein from transposon gypsy, partial [Mucuna pruriens]